MTNEQVIEAWYDGQCATSDTGNLFSEGESLFSYGHPYHLAEKYERCGLAIVLINEQGYSQTTSQHKSLVKKLVPNYMEVPNPYIGDSEMNDIRHIENLEHLEEQLSFLKEKSKRARKCDYTDDIAKAEQNIKDYKHVFNLRD